MAKRTIDPAAGGDVDPVDKKGSEGTQDALTPDKVSEMIKEQLGSLRGELNQSITGAVKRNLGEFLEGDGFGKRLGETLASALAAKEAEKNAKPPTPTEALTSQIEILNKRVEEEFKARQKAEEQARQEKLANGLQSAVNMLDGRDGRPNLRKDAREAVLGLLSTGFGLPSKPQLDDGGRVVVQQPDGTGKNILDILTNGYFGNASWALENPSFKGSGASGQRSAGTPPPAKGLGDKYGTVRGDQELAEQYKGNPEGLLEALKGRAARS